MTAPPAIAVAPPIAVAVPAPSAIAVPAPSAITMPPPPGATRDQVMAYISALLRDAEREATHVGLLMITL